MSGGPNTLRWLDRAFVVIFSAYVVVPLAITAVMAFSDDNIIRFPIRGYSTRWFDEFANNALWVSAALNSLKIATLTAFISLAVALPAAYGLARSPQLRKWGGTLMLIPLFVPAVVLGISVAISFGSITVFGFQLYGSPLMVACAHSLWAMPLALTVLQPSFEAMDHSMVEAAGDLGASPLRAFLTVTLPVVGTAVVSATLFAFITSLNEFVMAIFLTTRDSQTLPVLLFLSLRSSASPQLAVASTVLAGSVFSTIAVGVMMNWLIKRRGTQNA